MKRIHELVREAEDNDKNGQTTFSTYVKTSMREDIDKTEAYLNSKHISGDKDYLGREKPFFNIVIGHRNIYFRATDIDRKNIFLRATKEKDEIKAFLMTILLQQWMRKSKFGQFLNDWGLTLANHGSAISKFVEKYGELSCEVKDWNTMLVDPIDFGHNIKVEKLWFTPAQLKKNKSYNKEMVKDLCDNTTSREVVGGEKKDNKSNYILVYEVHGELPLSLLTDDEKDEETYVQQMHTISFLAKKDGKEFDDYTLFRGREKRDPYRIDHLIKKDGQTYTGGAVKNLFEAQWMVNHSEKQIKDHLDLASKIIFQTSDASIVGKNVLTNIENGQILFHKTNEPMTKLNNTPDIAAMQSFKNDWQSVANQINGISEAMQGVNPPSGSAWRQTQALLQESHSLFELMTENKGLSLEEMIREFILPHFKKRLDTTEEISSILEDYQINEIDSRYIPNEVNRRMNKKKKDTILSGQIYDTGMEVMDEASMLANVQKELVGNQRFIKPSEIPTETWKDIMKNIEFELEVDVTGEPKDIQGALATLSTALTTIASNPQVLQDPNVKLIFSKILSLSGGISPLEIRQAQVQPAPAIAGQVGGEVSLPLQTKQTNQ